MGGLGGMVHFRGEPPDLGVLANLSSHLAHRGPDGEGQFAEGPVALSHRLQATLAAKSVQPVVSDDLVLLMDGWIFDPDDVVRKAGSDEPIQTDTQALLAAWRRWHFDAMHHLEGAFSAAIWNRRNRTLWLLRDRLGTAPLYWARDGHRFAFASELPALLQVPWVSRELAREHLAEYLSFRNVHAPRTLLRDVHQVEPGRWLEVNADGLKTRRYWTLSYAPSGTPRPREADVIPALQDAVQHAVQRRLAGGAPTGLYLSGGLGSAAIGAAARKLHRDLPTFTITFADDPNPESPFAGRVARLLRMEHHELVVGTAELAGSFVRTVRALGHPVGTPAAVVQLLLADYAREHVRVVLSGDGGEELFGGRMLDGLARQLRLARAVSRLPYGSRKLLATGLSRSRRVRRLTAPLDRWGLVAGIGGSDQFSVTERRELLRDPDLVRPDVRQEVLAPFYDGLDTDPINAVLHAYLCSWLSDGSLVRADRTAAASGLDIRFPLLDREVVEMAAALPGSFKLRRVGGSVHTRWPLRSMLAGILPPPLVNRPKRGMPTPLDTWLYGTGRLFLEEWCARLRVNRYGLWNVEALERLRRRTSRQQGYGIRLWSLFILECWLDEVVGAKP